METWQLFEYNVQMQKSCATFMSKFLDRIRTSLYGPSTSSEEVAIQLTGLEQVRLLPPRRFRLPFPSLR